MTAILAYITFNSSFSSGIFSSTIRPVSHESHVSPEVGVFGVSP